MDTQFKTLQDYIQYLEAQVRAMRLREQTTIEPFGTHACDDVYRVYPNDDPFSNPYGQH